MARERMIGLDRPLRLEWLDAAAAQLARGASDQEAREHVWRLLDGVVAGETPQSARGKTMTVLSRVWITVPESRKALRQRAIQRIESAMPEERIATHWALTAAAYPLFFDVTTIIGKTIRLHETVSLARITRRITESWGDRSTLRPAIQRVVRMLVAWGTLIEDAKPGDFRAADSHRISAPFAELLVESLLHNTGGSFRISDLQTHPSLFPFRLHLSAVDLKDARRYVIDHVGDEEMIALR